MWLHTHINLYSKTFLYYSLFYFNNAAKRLLFNLYAQIQIKASNKNTDINTKSLFISNPIIL